MMSEIDEVISTLHDGLIMEEIVRRLPLQSLCRFKCVSKSFLSFIQALPFVKTPILWQIQEDSCLQVIAIDSDDGSTTSKYAFVVGPDSKRFDIDNGRYCNGVNCFVYNQDVGFTVFNAYIDREITIPLQECCYDCMFCFDPLSKKYKILSWVDTDAGLHMVFCVVTVEKGYVWRPVFNPFDIDYLHDPHAIVNGEPFWIYNEHERIISFQPASEEFRAIDFPDELGHEEAYECCIFDFEGSLCFVVQHRREEPTISLWILKDDVWVTMKKNITLPYDGTDLQEYYSICPSGPWVVDSFNFSSHGGELIVAGVGDPNSESQFLFKYSFLRNQFKRIKITGLPCYHFEKFLVDGIRVRPFVENGDSLPELE